MRFVFSGQFVNNRIQSGHFRRCAAQATHAGPLLPQCVTDVRERLRKVTCVSGLSGDVSLQLALFLRGGWMEPH